MTHKTKPSKARRRVHAKRTTWVSRPMPTMNQVAEASGFSQMTVSRAFLDSAPIRKETRDTILKVAAEIGYFHNKTASILASKQLRAFGIVLPTLLDSIYRPFVDGAREVFEAHGADYLLQTIDYTPEREVHAIGALISQRVRAILLPSIGHTRQIKHMIKESPVPVIEVGNLPKRPIHFAVGHSDFDAGYAATRRLIEVGRRRIAILCGYVDQTSNARDRLNGYLQALTEAGLRISRRRIAETEHTVEAGLQALDRLDRLSTLDAIVIAGEIWSSAALLEMLRKGKRIPEDVAMIGIGETDLGRYLPVPMSFVALPRRETGKVAAEMAVTLSEEKAVEERVVRLPVKLMIHESG